MEAEDEGKGRPRRGRTYRRTDGSEGTEYVPTNRSHVEPFIKRIHASMPDHDRISLRREDPWD